MNKLEVGDRHIALCYAPSNNQKYSSLDILAVFKSFRMIDTGTS